MKTLVECVPNVSEGRRPKIIQALAQAIEGVSSVHVLNVQSDASHHRSVFTVAGPGPGVVEGILQMIPLLLKNIDLTCHQGVHPRAGALDVVPFIPLHDTSMETCIHLAHTLGGEIGRRFHIPVFLYGQAATRPHQRKLSELRNLQFEGLRSRIGTHPDFTPDFGPAVLHPTAGATFVGARSFLIAYNVYLDTPDVRIAKALARVLRERSGGLPAVQALGFFIEERQQAQVSMNLTNFHRTSIPTAFQALARQAQRYGVEPVESELVGLAPQAALEGFSPQDVLFKKPPGPEAILETHLQKYGLLTV